MPVDDKIAANIMTLDDSDAPSLNESADTNDKEADKSVEADNVESDSSIDGDGVFDDDSIGNQDSYGNSVFDSNQSDNLKAAGHDKSGKTKPFQKKIPFIDKFTRPCKSRSNVSVMIVAIAVIIAFASTYAAQAYDNDMWFIIASGREIVEHGIPMDNVFTWLPNLSTVIQQWLPDVLTYLTYSNFGMIGICLFVAAEIAALVLSLVFLSNKASGGKMPYETSLVLIAASIPALGSYISIRPQILTMIGITWTLIFLEAYRHTNDWRWLVGLPITMIVHVNCHMAMAPFDLFAIFLYLIPDFTKGIKSIFPAFTYSLRGPDYARMPLLVALIITCLATLINPYGINGALYLVSSYGAADYGNYIKEMGTLTPWNSDFGMGMVLMTFIGAIAIGRNRRKINFPGTVLLIICTVLSYQHVRNVWLGALLTLPIAFQAFANVGCGNKENSDNPDPIIADSAMWRIICSAFAAVAVLSCVSESVATVDINIDRDSTSTPKCAMNWLVDNNVSKDAKIFNHFNSGGYIEWRGYKTFIDARPELFEPAITGVDKHYYQEYVDTSIGKGSYDDMLSRYAFDFLIVNDDTTLYDSLLSNRDYVDVCNGSGYALFKRIGTTTIPNETSKSSETQHENMDTASGGTSSLSAAIDEKKTLLPIMDKYLN